MFIDILNKEKVLFIKCNDYITTLEYITKKLDIYFHVIFVSDKTDLFKEIKFTKAMSFADKPIPPDKKCIITTELLNSFTDSELSYLYIIKKATQNFYWVDVGESLVNRKIEKVVKIIDFTYKEKELFLDKVKNMLGERFNVIYPFIKNMPLKNIIDFLNKQHECNVEDLPYLKADVLAESFNIERIKDIVVPDKVGGCINYKQWINKISYIRKKYSSYENKNKIYNYLPKGAVLLGWTGTGKSYLAKMTASYLKIPLFKFDLGMVMNKYVGESEKRMKDFLHKIEILSPCIVWLDEMDKFFISWDKEDTGVVARLLAEFLFFLQENKGDIFFIATINNFEQLPVELIRKGRFTTLWYVDLPDEQARREILKIYLIPTFFEPLTAEQENALIKITEGFTPAEICSCVDELKLDALYTGKRIPYQNIFEHFKTTSKSIELQKKAFEKFKNFISEHKIVKA